MLRSSVFAPHPRFVIWNVSGIHSFRIEKPVSHVVPIPPGGLSTSHVSGAMVDMAYIPWMTICVYTPIRLLKEGPHVR